MAGRSRHAKLVNAAVWLADHGAYIGWGAASDGKAVRRTWKSDMTRDPDVIRAMLTEGRNSLIVPAGRLVVIDFDRAGSYELAVAAGLPATLTIETPSRRIDAGGQPYIGRHVYALVPDGFDVTTLPGAFAGGEIRRSVAGEQSMVLGPWSERAEGVYTPALGTPRTLGELPATVTDWLIPNRASSSGPPTSRGDWRWDESIGSRHDHLRDRIRYWCGTGIAGIALRDLVWRYIDEHEIPLTIGGRTIDAGEVERMCAGAEQKFGADRPPVGLPWFSPREIAMGTPAEPEWVVRPGLVAVGAITELDGKIKAAGKTTLTLHLVASVLDGAAFLGEPTRRCRVLYVTEQSRQTFADALRRAGLAGRGDELRVLFREDIGAAAWPAVVAACRQDGYDLVVLDTIGKLAGIRQENEAGEWSEAMSPVMDLAASGRAVILCRHDRKGGGEVGESGRGSSQASGDVDIILALRRPEGHQAPTRRVIETLSRYAETPDQIVVELTSDGYVLLGTDQAVAASDARSFVSAVLGSEFQQSGTGLSTNDLRELGEDRSPRVTRSAIQGALTALLEAGEIERLGLGRPHHPYIYVSAEPPSAESAETQTYTADRPADSKPNRLNIDPAATWAALDAAGGITGGRTDA